MDVVSPWQPELRALLVSGATDAAVLRASTALSSTTARKSLHNVSAVVTEQPVELLKPGETDTRTNQQQGPF